MAIKFQYNKTALQSLDKQLKMRQKALPTIKNKESALRIEVKRAKNQAKDLDEKLINAMAQYDEIKAIWSEFDSSLVAVADVNLSIKKIAGVKTPVLDEVIFSVKEFSLFDNPGWYLLGIAIIKELTQIGIEREFFYRKMELLDYARRKTTQKVNLYEKVQIPGYEDAIRKIKRFLEDEENLSKSSQKIVKSRQQQKEMEVQS